MTVKVLDGRALFCQTDGCETPALYLFSETGLVPQYSAHCALHARKLAAHLRMKLPPAKQGRLLHWSEVSA
jgi:hypothetical protein